MYCTDGFDTSALMLPCYCLLLLLLLLQAMMRSSCSPAQTASNTRAPHQPLQQQQPLLADSHAPIAYLTTTVNLSLQSASPQQQQQQHPAPLPQQQAAPQHHPAAPLLLRLSAPRRLQQ
jgi:hypothetical protein